MRPRIRDSGSAKARHHDHTMTGTGTVRDAVPRTPLPRLVDRILARCVETDTGCWTWTGPPQKNGYGRTQLGGWGSPQGLIHRLVYEHMVAPIPEGLQIDHLCKVRLCVNPAHLDVVTSRVNTLRSNAPSAINARRTHCVHGHPFSGDNLIMEGRKRRCRTCIQTRGAAAYQRRLARKAAAA